MPKTLAALPRSQYATLLELVLGKNLFVFSWARGVARVEIWSANGPNGTAGLAASA